MSSSRVRVCDARGLAPVEMDCPSATTCMMGQCQPSSMCTPGEASCENTTTRRVCNADGRGFATMACPSGQTCVNGFCDARLCTPGSATCASTTARRVCNADGAGYTTVECRGPGVSVAACAEGTCRLTCSAGFGDCDGDSANGCETALQTSTNHCGRCGNACPSGMSCQTGVCAPQRTCTYGLSACGSVCRNTVTAATDCGACGRACAPQESCRLGQCVSTSFCQTQYGFWSATTGQCGPERGSGSYCGSGSPCAEGMVCARTYCALACPVGSTTCGRDCANLLIDPVHCGRCGNTCPAGQICEGGACVALPRNSRGWPCLYYQRPCGDVLCTDLRFDPEHCGMCGRVCASAEVCLMGRCVPSTRCVTPYYVNVPDGVGSSRRTCVPSGIYDGRCGPGCLVSEVCRGPGMCDYTCLPGTVQCGHTCVDLATNLMNCGRCGNVCEPGQVCRSSTCVAP